MCNMDTMTDMSVATECIIRHLLSFIIFIQNLSILWICLIIKLTMSASAYIKYVINHYVHSIVVYLKFIHRHQTEEGTRRH